MSRLSLSYGQMPTRDQFDRMFARQCGEDGRYLISNDKGGRDGDYTASQLWKLLQVEVSEFNNNEGDENGDFVSAVLSTLGIEWI